MRIKAQGTRSGFSFELLHDDQFFVRMRPLSSDTDVEPEETHQNEALLLLLLLLLSRLYRSSCSSRLLLPFHYSRARARPLFDSLFAPGVSPENIRFYFYFYFLFFAFIFFFAYDMCLVHELDTMRASTRALTTFIFHFALCPASA